MKYKIAGGLLVLLAAATGFDYRAQASEWIAHYLQQETKEPVPTWRLRSRNYVITATAPGELTGLQTTLVAAPIIRTGPLKIAWLEEEGTIVAPGDVVVRFESVEAALSLEENQNSFTRYRYEIEKKEEDSRSQMQILEMDGEEADIELEYAEKQVRRDEQIFSRWEIQEQIMSAALALYKAGTIDQKRGLMQELSQAGLRILNIEQGKAKAEMDLAQHTLSSLEAKAPAQGVVLHRRWRLSPLKVGDDVWPGLPIVEIANLEQFQAQVRVNEVDISGINVDNPVEVRLNSLPGDTFPGKVKQVGRMAAQISRQDPRKYFLCDVVLDVPTDVMDQLKPGIQLTAFIEVGQRTGVLVVPSSAVIKKDADFVVFVKRGEEFVQQKVEISETDYGFLVIEGVRDGDEVALHHPYNELELHLPDFSSPPVSTRRPRFVF